MSIDRDFKITIHKKPKCWHVFSHKKYILTVVEEQRLDVSFTTIDCSVWSSLIISSRSRIPKAYLS